jgi:quercetin dioxygenase-like cupin family protein
VVTLAFSRLPLVSAFDELGELRPIAIWDGVVARAVHGERITLAVVELEPWSVVVQHAHENEQLGMVLTGSLRFRVGDEERELRAGETWRIPSNTPHEVHTGPEGAVVIDVFVPPRDDWDSLETLEPRPPLWP